ncbi:MAG TPA: ParB N-terminal domain-containing protein [Dissulfurispiraceae bacterium]|nr:ParB N-terminal domain-containing protein [Dissulfurispiraceae bacterium]
MIIERKKLSELKPAEYNPRTISDAALAGLKHSIERFGLVEPIIWNKRTGHVCGGHQRLKVLLNHGETETDVVVVDLPAIEEKALNLTLNNPAIQGVFTEGVTIILDELQAIIPEVLPALKLDMIVNEFKDAGTNDTEQDQWAVAVGAPETREVDIPVSPIGGLVWRPSLCKTRTVRFISVRKWNEGSKEADLEALKNGKYACEPDLVDAVADELTTIILELMNNIDGWVVTNPPPGGSRTNSTNGHFATSVASRVASLCNIKYRTIFAPRIRDAGMSHGPHTKGKTSAITSDEDPVRANYILIDDLATTGSTIEECVHYLESYGSIIPIVWLYGNVTQYTDSTLIL